MNQKLLSIIIVNFNGESFLKNCIDSIVKNCQTIDFEIIIVDNNSSDESIKLIENEFKEVVLIKNNINIGFASANNMGVKRSQGEYLLLLNNDTLLLDNLKPAIEILKEDQSVGLVGIKMLDTDRSYRQSAGCFPSPLRLLKLKSMMIQSNGFKDGDFDKHRHIFLVDWVEGSFMLTRNNLWDELNGMDNAFFMYSEDIDFCKRLKSLNKKTVYLPELNYIHFGGFNIQRNKFLKIGLIRYVNKHFTGMKKWMSRLNIEINFFVKEYVKKTV
ncbi:MAG: glycosyltransferase family 2 protein [Bacteroidales bacterium]|nr:glycosyltransferase family 2 protein [Bacteroidales bacterium]